MMDCLSEMWKLQNLLHLIGLVQSWIGEVVEIVLGEKLLVNIENWEKDAFVPSRRVVFRVSYGAINPIYSLSHIIDSAFNSVNFWRLDMNPVLYYCSKRGFKKLI